MIGGIKMINSQFIYREVAKAQGRAVHHINLYHPSKTRLPCAYAEATAQA